MLLGVSVISLSSGSSSVRRGKNNSVRGGWEGDHRELCSQTEGMSRLGPGLVHGWQC